MFCRMGAGGGLITTAITTPSYNGRLVHLDRGVNGNKQEGCGGLRGRGGSSRRG